MMDRIFSFVRLHALAFLCWSVAFFFWKDYFTHAHHQVTREELVPFTGTMTQTGRLISLPSGHQGGHYLLLEESQRSLDIAYFDDLRAFQEHTPKGATLTITHSPEIDLRTSGESATAFSLVYQGKERIDTESQIKSYNAAIVKKRNNAAATTVGGFFLFGLVWFVHRRFFKR